LQRRPVDLANVVRQAAGAVSSFLEQRQQTLKVEVVDEVGIVQLEEEKIHDSLVQLLINAIKFTPDGGTIELSAQRLPESVIIKVADHGTGIDAASLPYIFDLFFTRFDVFHHSSGTYEYDRRGLGLGLCVVKAFVEMHGGQVSVESELGRGTTFTIELPAIVA
jgi:signal transduction histidine kinase